MNDICIAFFVILAVGFRRSLNKLARVFQLDLSSRAVSGRLIVSTGIAMRSSRKCEAALRTRYPIIREQPESRFANLLEGDAVAPIDARLLSHIVPFRDAIYAAGRHVDEALYSRLAGEFGEMNRTLMVDFVGNGWTTRPCERPR